MAEMREYILNDGFYQHIVIQWQERWYKIPFVVIQDEAELMYLQERKPIEQCQLSNWLLERVNCRNYFGDEMPKAISEFKKLFEDRMPGMEAYLTFEAQKQII